MCLVQYSVIVSALLLNINIPRIDCAVSLKYCTDLSPQNSLDIDALLGMWYGVEVIQHLDKTLHLTNDSCPKISIDIRNDPQDTRNYARDYDYSTYGQNYGGSTRSYGKNYGSNYGNTGHNYGRSDYGRTDYGRTDYARTDYGRTDYGRSEHNYGSEQNYGLGNYKGGHRRQGSADPEKGIRDVKYRNLTLLWNEGSNSVEYSLRFDDKRPGFWLSSGPYNGSMLIKQFNDYAGNIQVIKAVNTHLVLTFCYRLPDSQLFTILLAREPELSEEDIEGVHNLLGRRHLSTYKAKRVCRNGASTSLPTASVYSVLILTLCFMWLKSN